jgi:hypothetical protein
MVTLLRQQLEAIHGGSYICGLQRVSELEYLPPARLQQLHGQLRRDIDTLEKVFTSVAVFVRAKLEIICIP